MERKQIELIVAPIAVVIAIVMIFFTIKKSTRRQPQSRPSDDKGLLSSIDSDLSSLSQSISFVEVAQSKDSFGESDLSPEYKVEDLAWGRDPFVLDKAVLFSPGMDQSRVAKLERLSTLDLIGTIVSPDDSGDSIAIINGENLKVGDVISGFVLQEIKPNSVLLQWDNEEFILKLWEEEAEVEKEPLSPPY